VALLPNVNPVLSRYVADGWQLVIVTNQGGVASGYITLEQACAVQRRVIALLAVPVVAAYLCPHMPNAPLAEYALNCPNRKPRPGAVLRALSAFGVHSQDALFVGDSSTDRQAARSAGVSFCWADRFFEREIDRGLRLHEKGWVQVRQRPVDGSCVLDLQATKGKDPIAHLALKPLSDEVLMLDRAIEKGRVNSTVERFLIEAALEWSADRRFRQVLVPLAQDAFVARAFWQGLGFAERMVIASVPRKRGQVLLCCDLQEHHSARAQHPQAKA
jgi:histidinol-phosphate phosphatase family protein